MILESLRLEKTSTVRNFSLLTVSLPLISQVVVGSKPTGIRKKCIKFVFVSKTKKKSVLTVFNPIATQD